MSRPQVRRVARGDGPGLVALHLVAFGNRDHTVEQIAEHYERLLSRIFDNLAPGAPASPGVVAERDGEVVAMMLGFSNPLRFKGEPAWSIAASGLSVHPDVSAPAVTRALLDDGLDDEHLLLFGDRVNPLGRRSTIKRPAYACYPHYSLRWARLLRPGRAAVGGLARRSEAMTGRIAGAALAAAGRLVDRLGQPILQRATPLPTPPAKQRVEPLTADALAEFGPELIDEFEVRIDIDSPEVVAWRWLALEHTLVQGTHHRFGVWSAGGSFSGWFELHVWPSGAAEVVSLMARPRREAAVVAALYERSAELGATSLHGNVTWPMHVALGESGAVLHMRDGAFLATDHDREVHGLLTTGRAYLSSAEGEYPMLIAPRQPPDPLIR